MSVNELTTTALSYLDSGLCVLPNLQTEKRPAVSWKTYQKQLPTKAEVQAWFPTHRVGILCGAISGHAEMIDFDNGGSHFEAWADVVCQWQEGLLDKLVVEQSPSGGYHVVYRCPGVEIPGNMKLAELGLERPNGDKFEHTGKSVQPRRIGDKFFGVVCLIETRGEGGQFVCAPSTGYRLLKNDFLHLPEITAGERELLINAARLLNEWQEPTPPRPPTNHAASFHTHSDGLGVADRFNQKTEFSDLLNKHGWKQVRAGGKYTYWRRPGKDDSWSASVIEGQVFKVFSSNAAPFEGMKAYSKFQVYAVLEHGGDWSKAAKFLFAQERTTQPLAPSPTSTAVKCDPFAELSAQVEDEIAGRRFACLWPWDHVTRSTQALVPGSITVLCSGKGSGKSFLLIEAGRFWWRRGYNPAILMLEKDRKFHLRRALAQHVSRADLSDIDWVNKNPVEVRKILYENKDMLNGFGPCIYERPEMIALPHLLRWLEDQVNAGRRIIAIDPITAKDPSQKPWIDDHAFIMTAQKILKDSNSSLVVVAHPPKTSGRDKAGKAWGDDAVAGGMAYQNFTDTIMSMEYMPKAEKMTVCTPIGVIEHWVNRKLQLRKTRSSAGQGYTIGFFFNGKTLCFEERGILEA